MKKVILLLIVANVIVWFFVVSSPLDATVVIACDVGQGDAILIQHRETQILIDGGPDSSVLTCLGKYMPPWDRKVELVVLTHAQADHLTGLIDVFETYGVANFLTSGVANSTQGYQVLKDLVLQSQARVITARAGSQIGMGLIHLDVLWPTQAFIDATTDDDEQSKQRQSSRKSALEISAKGDLNFYSVVLGLNVHKFWALLTGDIDPVRIDSLLEANTVHTMDYIKVPHHGSKNGLTQKLVNSINPSVAVISVGKNNKYRHPDQEVIDMLTTSKVVIMRTDEVGDVVYPVPD